MWRLMNLKEGRKRFTEDEWLDIMMRSIGMEPDTLSEREKWLASFTYGSAGRE